MALGIIAGAIGLGSAVAGAVGNVIEQKNRRKDLRRALAQQKEAAMAQRAIAVRNALSVGATNPLSPALSQRAAMQSANQAGQAVDASALGAQASQSLQQANLLSQQRSDLGQTIQQLGGSLGGALSAFGAQSTANQSPAGSAPTAAGPSLSKILKNFRGGQ